MARFGPSTIREAQRSDVPAIVALLADDPLGARRETLIEPLPESYYEAFDAIAADPQQLLVVAEVEGQPAGTLQLTFLPSLTYEGGWRAQIEGVRVAGERRGEGVGAQLVGWAVDRATARGCRLIQLTSDKARPDALRFYERLGFRASHEGMKRLLPRRGSA